MSTDTQSTAAEISQNLTYKEAASRLNVSLPTMHRWGQQGKITVRRFSSSIVRIPMQEIIRLEQEAQQSSCKTPNNSTQTTLA